MEAGNFVAGYAALVATIALAWNIYSARAATKRKVEVQVQFAFIPDLAGNVQEVVTVTVTNHGQAPVSATSAGLDLQDGSRGTIITPFPPPGADLPGIIPPNESRMTYFAREDLEDKGFDLRRRLTGWANLATGERVTSKRVQLLS